MRLEFTVLIKMLIIYKQIDVSHEKGTKYSDFKAHHKN